MGTLVKTKRTSRLPMINMQNICVTLCILHTELAKKEERQTDKYTDEQTDRLIDRQTDKEI